MIVGFTIVDFKGHEKEAVEYIQKVCILDSGIAQNIVNVGPGVNIFSNSITLSELQAQPFQSLPIETRDDRYLLVSAVNFNTELLYNGNILRLAPTEYIYIGHNEVSQFEKYITQGLVQIIPDILDGQIWVLSKNSWDDDGVWVDEDFWRD